uniref:Polysaccharide biosynthesis domain containing 1 n=1 Tax=Eptatretus burgeri TaxID=7764 RepID=A0A8C4QKD4_EPTBU
GGGGGGGGSVHLSVTLKKSHVLTFWQDTGHPAGDIDLSLFIRHPTDLISSAEPEFLHLTEHDDEIYNEFRRSFPTMMIAILNPEDLKSESSKKKWRAFCLLFDGKVAEFNFGTLLRLNATAEYSEENTIFAAPLIHNYVWSRILCLNSKLLIITSYLFSASLSLTVQDKQQKDSNTTIGQH